MARRSAAARSSAPARTASSASRPIATCGIFRPRSALVGKAFYIYWPHGVPFLNNGRGFPDSENSLLKHVPVFNRWFYHVKLTNEQPTLSDYPQFRVPFYPQLKRMKRIR